MKRGYTQEVMMEKLHKLHKINPLALIATDVIAGFLRETEKNREILRKHSKPKILAYGKALEQADLGAMPSIHGEVIHITLPPLTQDRRTQLLRLVGKTVEEGRIALRRDREEAIEGLKVRERAGEISEDALFRGKEQVEEAVKRANEKLEELRVQKEQELETV